MEEGGGDGYISGGGGVDHTSVKPDPGWGAIRPLQAAAAWIIIGKNGRLNEGFAVLHGIDFPGVGRRDKSLAGDADKSSEIANEDRGGLWRSAIEARCDGKRTSVVAGYKANVSRCSDLAAGPNETRVCAAVIRLGDGGNGDVLAILNQGLVAAGAWSGSGDHETDENGLRRVAVLSRFSIASGKGFPHALLHGNEFRAEFVAGMDRDNVNLGGRGEFPVCESFGRPGKTGVGFESRSEHMPKKGEAGDISFGHKTLSQRLGCGVLNLRANEHIRGGLEVRSKGRKKDSKQSVLKGADSFPPEHLQLSVTNG